MTIPADVKSLVSMVTMYNINGLFSTNVTKPCRAVTSAETSHLQPLMIAPNDSVLPLHVIDELKVLHYTSSVVWSAL